MPVYIPYLPAMPLPGGKEEEKEEENRRRKDIYLCEKAEDRWRQVSGQLLQKAWRRKEENYLLVTPAIPVLPGEERKTGMAWQATATYN